MYFYHSLSIWCIDVILPRDFGGWGRWEGLYRLPLSLLLIIFILISITLSILLPSFAKVILSKVTCLNFFLNLLVFFDLLRS